jgi:hypothetical protein
MKLHSLGLQGTWTGGIMAIGVIRTAWSGTSGGPGLTQLFIRNATNSAITAGEAQSAVNAVRAFWDGIKAYLPDEILLTVQSTCDIYNETNGDLIASITAATAPVSVQGTSTNVYSMAAGFKVNLMTGRILNGRRVRGAIYVVPASSIVYNSNGTVLSGARTTVNTAGSTMMASLNAAGLFLVVYTRPVPAPNARNGDKTDVSQLETNEKSCILRGRRD